jgi:membrane glycosyltransferase
VKDALSETIEAVKALGAPLKFSSRADWWVHGSWFRVRAGVLGTLWAVTVVLLFATLVLRALLVLAIDADTCSFGPRIGVLLGDQ